MPLYRPRQHPVEAFRLTIDDRRDVDRWPWWLIRAWNAEPGTVGAIWPVHYPNSDGRDDLLLATASGTHRVALDDWIIRAVDGTLYPCKPFTFLLTYELVTDLAAASPPNDPSPEASP